MIDESTPASRCRDYITERSTGYVKKNGRWYHPVYNKLGSGRKDRPLPAGLDVLRCLPEGWIWCRYEHWWKAMFGSHVVRVGITENDLDDAARLVALAWQEHDQEHKR